MKKLILSLVAIATISLSSFGQVPEGFKYQAVVRDAGNLILNNQAVGMQLTIQQGSIGGTAVYSETFIPTSNAYGLVNIEIGSGNTTDDFSTIAWSAGPYFIETAMDVTGGTTYVVMGTSQLMSVPYALYAKTSGNGQGPVGPAGATGAVGATGATGITGADGIDGIDGAVGPQGIQGLPGLDGADGIDGAVGPTGATGITGADGVDGIDGAVGPQGIQGLIGLDGADGIDGAVGPTGPAGSYTAGTGIDITAGVISVTSSTGPEYLMVSPDAIVAGYVSFGSASAVNGVSYNSVTDEFTLKAGKTYMLDGAVYMHTTTSGVTYSFVFYDKTNNTNLGTAAYQRTADYSGTMINQPAMSAIVTPVTDIQVGIKDIYGATGGFASYRGFFRVVELK
jgi:hypothetical protein